MDSRTLSVLGEQFKKLVACAARMVFSTPLHKIKWLCAVCITLSSIFSTPTIAGVQTRPAIEGYAFSVYLFPNAADLGQFFCETDTYWGGTGTGIALWFSRVEDVSYYYPGQTFVHPPIKVYCRNPANGAELSDSTWLFQWARTCATPGFSLSPAPVSSFAEEQVCIGPGPDPNKDLGCPNPSVGNPINPGTFNKVQNETDYTGSGAFPLTFTRVYNSSPAAAQSKANLGSAIGNNWGHNYDRRLRPSQPPGQISYLVTVKYYTGTAHGWFPAPVVGSSQLSFVNAARPDGKVIYFAANNGIYSPDSDISDKLDKLTDSAGNTIGWKYTSGKDDDVELYDATGKLLSITNRAGLAQTLSYDTQGRLTSVTDSFGRNLVFSYDSANRMATMTDPAGGIYQYGYDAKGNLTGVTYPEGKARSYVYNEPTQTGNADLPYALTGIVDENGNRFATYTYDSFGRAISSEHAGGVEKVSLLYFNQYLSQVTDALGVTRTYSFQNIAGSVRNTLISGPPCTSCGANASAATSYDANGNVASRTDFNGNVTTYSYDLTRNLETSRTEASGTPLARTISTEWHPTFHLPTKLTEPNRVSTFVYDASGNLTQKTVTAGTLSRTWRYTYNTNGQMTLSDGPRTDATDTTTYVYNSSGNLTTTLNALNQITQITAYDPHGRPLTVQDPNGLITTLSYDLRGRLVSRSVGGEVTGYQYDGVGNLTKTTLPDGSFMSFTYDAAHRLTQITDQLGNRIVYTLDAMGNRTKEDIFDPSNALTQTRSRVFNQLSRLAQDIGAQAQTTNYQYDNNGNRTAVTDPLNHSTSNSYDNLNRLIQVTDPNNGLTRYSYDANDQLTQVTDPKGLVTTYTYDGLGNRTQVTSPDSGVTVNTYDSAGNLISQKDARGLTTTYTYDALNRITKATYADGTSTTYQYDTGINSIGRLNKLTDQSGGNILTTQWSYDARGRVIQKQQQVFGTTQTLRYSYTAQGQLSSMTYPSGKVINYSYTQAKLSSLSLGTTPLLSNLQYQAFGPPKAWNWGNNTVYSRGYDQDGRLSSYPLGGSTRTLGYDAAYRITAYTESSAANNQSFGYDNLDRLTQFTGLSTGQGFTYDLDGNRLTQTQGASTSGYTYPSTSNRLSQVSGPSPKTYSYDAMGNLLADGTNTYSYNARGRLSYVSYSNRSNGYHHNGLGQRVAKSGWLAVTDFNIYTYDEQGHLIGEYDAYGAPIQETVYLGDTPVAVLGGTTPAPVVYPIYTDHLNTPRVITDQTNKVIWNWASDPFGSTAANEDPDGDGVKFTYNLRFPGQYYDRETGLHYNYFRDYDPRIGRYVESDPVGLRGGINTYAYVGGSPIKRFDPFGLYNVGPPNPEINTIVCDGNDGIEIQVLPLDEFSKKCGIGECIAVHEEVHRQDALRAVKDVCKGKPRGTVVLFPMPDRALSEIKASEAEIACLKAKLNKDCACTNVIKSRIAQMEQYRDSFR